MKGTGDHEYHIDLPQQIGTPNSALLPGFEVEHMVELRCQSPPVCRESSRGFDFVHNLLHMTGEKVLQPFVDSQRQLVALFNGASGRKTTDLGGRCIRWHGHEEENEVQHKEAKAVHPKTSPWAIFHLQRF